MDERRNASPPPVGRIQARRARSDGIIGRLTYRPAQDGDGIGRLSRNRATDETPHFKQVTPFVPWCPPTKHGGPRPSVTKPTQIARAQEHWLLEHLPEASIDDEVVESLLLEEIASFEAKRQPTAPNSVPLCSVGEITDTRGTDAKGHPVLAVASGVAGNVLSFISIDYEEWAWTEADIRIRVHSPNALQGEWCQDALPISLVKFAVDLRKHDPIRWLVVQNGTSTTLYEPELRAIPMPVAGNSAQASGRSHIGQISANPLFTIPSGRTGGSLQSDVCFSRYPGMDTPQLVIIDQCGYWSVWDITGLRNSRPKMLTPIMRMCGNAVTGPIAKLPFGSVSEPRPHRILRLSPRHRSSGISNNSSKLSASPSMPTEADQGKLRLSPRLLLLLSNAKELHLFDSASKRSQSFSHMVLPNDSYRILDVAASRYDNSQAFVLTSTRVLWVAATEGKVNEVSLEILASCPHQKDVNDPSLRLDVSPGAYINDHKACFVCVRSINDTEMTVFWFMNPTPDTPARYHRELISLNSPSSLVGLHILPVVRLLGQAKRVSAAGRVLRNANLKFFQLLTLGHNLDVHSALCVWSDESSVTVLPPDSRLSSEESHRLRVKLLQHLTSAFAVPDEFDERIVFKEKGLGTLSLEDLRDRLELHTDFTLVAKRLSAPEELAPSAEEGLMPSAVSDQFEFLGEAVEKESKDGYMPRHSLLDLAKSHHPRDLLQFAREWDARQEALHRQSSEWLYVPEARRPLTDFGPDDLVERLRALFPEPQRSRGKNAISSQVREKVLQAMAAEMSLSNVGICAVPQFGTTITPAIKSEAADTTPSSSLPFRSSPPSIPSPSKMGTVNPPKTERSRSSRDQEVEDQEQDDRGDVVALRLRKYATINTSPTFTRDESSIGLTPWELGGDPDDISWRPGRDLDAEDAISRRRKKIEARRQRAERLSQRVFGSLGGGVSGGEESMLEFSSQSRSQSLSQGGLPTSQPTILSTNQPHPQRQPWEFSSQQLVGSPRVFVGSPLRREFRRESGVWSQEESSQGVSQGTPSQPTSQVLPGAFGGRLSPFKKSPLKKKGKRLSDARRLSGFR